MQKMMIALALAFGGFVALNANACDEPNAAATKGAGDCLDESALQAEKQQAAEFKQEIAGLKGKLPQLKASLGKAKSALKKAKRRPCRETNVSALKQCQKDKKAQIKQADKVLKLAKSAYGRGLAKYKQLRGQLKKVEKRLALQCE